MLCHGVLNMHEIKYGMLPIEDNLRECMKHGFKRIRIVYEKLGANICFFIYAIM
jgi:hypothetical protein